MMRNTRINSFESFQHVWSKLSFSMHHRPMTTMDHQTQSDTAPQYSDEWFSLRRKRLTSSTFSKALGFNGHTSRSELWHEKVFISDKHPSRKHITDIMCWGMEHEKTAKARYCRITGRKVDSAGLMLHSNQDLSWLGASPDGLLGSHGILEVKCPYIKAPWSVVPFYHMPQFQGLMEITGRDWVDVFCWTANGTTLFRVERDRAYWDLLAVMLKEFWWENVVPARAAVEDFEDEMSFKPPAMHRARRSENVTSAMRRVKHLENVMSYKPSGMHSLAKKALAHSYRLVKGMKVMCRENRGHAEFTEFYKES